MQKKTPALKSKGRYTLVEPWIANPAILYTCESVRSFEDIGRLGTDVYKTYYESMGVTNGTIWGGGLFDFRDEYNNNVNIITLLGDDNSVIYVPDTFIANFPDLSEVPYSHVILSFSIGAIPDSLLLDTLKSSVSALVAQQLGLIPVVSVHKLASDVNPTSSEHAALEAARLGAITLLETDRAKATRLTAENDLLRQQNQSLVAILQATGNLPA